MKETFNQFCAEIDKLNLKVIRNDRHIFVDNKSLEWEQLFWGNVSEGHFISTFASDIVGLIRVQNKNHNLGQCTKDSTNLNYFK